MLDKWCAEQCGVVTPAITFQGTKKDYWWKLGGKVMSYEWTIQDPRCREIVRERFRLHTMPSGTDGWACLLRDEIVGHGKTIAEAEIACITAIWEARDERD